jgi:hypothetical protein
MSVNTSSSKARALPPPVKILETRLIRPQPFVALREVFGGSMIQATMIRPDSAGKDAGNGRNEEESPDCGDSGQFQYAGQD